MVYCILLAAVLISLIAFSVTRHHIYLYMGIGSILLIPIYTGYFRRRIRKQFNILASISWDKPFTDISIQKVSGLLEESGSNSTSGQRFPVLVRTVFLPFTSCSPSCVPQILCSSWRQWHILQVSGWPNDYVFIFQWFIWFALFL